MTIQTIGQQFDQATPSRQATPKPLRKAVVSHPDRPQPGRLGRDHRRDFHCSVASALDSIVGNRCGLPASADLSGQEAARMTWLSREEVGKKKGALRDGTYRSSR